MYFPASFLNIRGRNAGYPAPPAQTRTCSFSASGSSVVLASALQNRLSSKHSPPADFGNARPCYFYPVENLVEVFPGETPPLAASSIYQLDTILNNPSENGLTEIEVVDCAHPLYGRRFPLVSLSHSPQGSRHALVTYQKDVLLRIPLSATSISTSLPALSNAKVSFDAVTELIDLAMQLKILHQERNAI